ncbi:MAG: alpha/beta hydrolase [Bacteroidia bacterium]|nr:alpha/beta hydrolase [Bacteroidia bacterium]
MTTIKTGVLSAFFILTSCNQKITMQNHNLKPAETAFRSGFSDINGLHMYYEIYGEGKPLVLIHGGGSTIESNFGKAIPLFAKNRQVIAVELQAHGRTSDRNAPLSFEQDADDVATLLRNLGISKADFFGFSNGGTTTLQIAIRHPEIVNRIVLGSALAKRNGVPDFFWGFMQQARLSNMPQQLQKAYLAVNPDSAGLRVMHDKDAARMLAFTDIPEEKLRAISCPALIIISDKDVITPEHALEMHRLISGSELAIIPGGHGEYIGEITTVTEDFNERTLIVPLIEKFLDKKPE